MIHSGVIAVLIISFIVMMAMGIEICYALGFSSFIACLLVGVTPKVLFTAFIGKIANSSLMAIPFFIIMGEFMNMGGITSRLVELADSLIGWMRGGLAMVNCLASMFFGGISGSPVADCSSLGPIEISMMKKQGYDTEFSTAITMASSIQGMIIPPSHTMVLFAVTAGGVSIAALYMGGLLAGILLGVTLMVYSYIMAVKRNYPHGTKFSLKRVGKALVRSVYGIIAMLIVVGGVLGGIMTATEAAAVGAVWSFIVAFFFLKEAKWSDLPGIFLRTAKSVATTLYLAAAAFAFSWIVTYLRIPQVLTKALLAFSNNKYVILMLINIICLFLGCFMNTSSIILIMVPMLLPIVQSFGMHPVQFGVMMVMNLGIGLLTPPVGSVLFVGSSISGIKIEPLIRETMPALIAMVIAMLLVTFIPPITTLLPHLLGYI